MTRAKRFATWTAVLSVAYILVFLQIVPLPLVEEETAAQIVPVIPWWLLVTFGSYSLWSLGWGLFTFRDCEEAYEELMGEISMAKADLRARGVTVD
ncbi:SubName: Full=Related to dolichol-phosphate mannosyltransferase subunit 3 {ECO:0000313/EMBL:CCA67734.1} [Serendipita indica DSM 11827]|uniref:Dolichol-phosphate mannosyltransferase subunit 3 n=1 Tax=Serendipita indica (strain DSM 11827) TaxID=1109443 RepID=G4T8U1_SERID|nr:SubName: Full=Related to dolichol-phosphate mannosyltransferase subunit 3 {ECO:0000313/EMBL:CCA67734.1} [Serendipita indica DSM 11827]CCA67734.1 related to dolichol-phosphate mannosyltransferase subunit 3 [Serendipita indica DSM 11827]